MVIEGTKRIPKPEYFRAPQPHFHLKSSLRPIDYATFVYLGLVGGLLVFFHNGVDHWPILVLAHVGVVAGILYLIRLEHSTNSKVVTFLRDSYPFFLYTFLFKEVSLVVNMFFPFWLEQPLIQWDLLLFRNHPTVWLQAYSSQWFSEWMAFSYWSYYVFIPFVGILLYAKKDRRLFHSYAFNLAVTMYTCYFLFLFLTARGPHETLAHLHIERDVGWIFDRMVRGLQNAAGISGAAFPSSHVAAMWISWIFAFRFRRWLGWLFLPLLLSLSFSVVYMQYHYAVDAIAGVLLSLMTYSLGIKIESRFRNVAATENKSPTAAY